MEIPAPAVLVRQHVPVTGRHQCPRGRDRYFEQCWSQYIAGFAPIEARMRDYKFNSTDKQGNKAQGGDPVSDADVGRVPRSNRRGRDRRSRSWDASGVAHPRMVSCGAQIAHIGWNAGMIITESRLPCIFRRRARLGRFVYVKSRSATFRRLLVHGRQSDCHCACAWLG